MCYIVEAKRHSDYFSMTIEKINMDIDFVKIWITSNYDFMLASNLVESDFLPFHFDVPFTRMHTTLIKFRETIIKPFNCKTANPEYVSEAQCLVDMFIDEHFSPCPNKCLPIQMNGLHYANNQHPSQTVLKLRMKFAMEDQKFGASWLMNFQTV